MFRPSPKPGSQSLAYRHLQAVPEVEEPQVLDLTRPCTDTYDCFCAACTLDRMRAVRRGVRPINPLPVSKAVAA